MTELQSNQDPALFQSSVQEQIASSASEEPHAGDRPATEALVAGRSVAGAEVRARLMAQFEQWLDRMLAGEEPPEGLPPELLAEVETAAGRPAPTENDADLYTLFSALTSLTGEIRLQGRAFKQLADAVAPLAVLPRGIEQLHLLQQDSADRIDQLSRQLGPPERESAEASLPSSKEMLGVLMDLYDRIYRGMRVLESASRTLESMRPRGWLRWPGRSRIRDAGHWVATVLEGYGLTVTRLEDLFSQWGVERIGESGDRFDPARMTAIQVAPAEGVEDGTVLDVYRSGYSVRGSVLATAQVKVALRNRMKEDKND